MAYQMTAELIQGILKPLIQSDGTTSTFACTLDQKEVVAEVRYDLELQWLIAHGPRWPIADHEGGVSPYTLYMTARCLLLLTQDPGMGFDVMPMFDKVLLLCDAALCEIGMHDPYRWPTRETLVETEVITARARERVVELRKAVDSELQQMEGLRLELGRRLELKLRR
ncbi:MAG: hypothetical protein Q9173_004914, partial [Seirophora scorigena]